jgi:mannosyltransferase OCH1-like enzyme
MKISQIYIGDVKHFAERYHAEEMATFQNVAGADYRLFDADEVSTLLKDNYGQETLDSFNTLIPPAYKTDLARLAVIDTYGGWYADIGNSVTNPTKMLELSALPIAMFNETADPNLRAQQGNLPSIQNGCFYSQPNSPTLQAAIAGINKKVSERYYGASAWDITGPTHLGGVVYANKPADTQIGTFEYLLNPKGEQQYAYVWVDGEVVAWFKTPGKQSMFKHPKNDYHTAWNERRVYV